MSHQLLQNFGLLSQSYKIRLPTNKHTLRKIRKKISNLFSHFYAHISIHISSLEGQGDLHSLVSATTC